MIITKQMINAVPCTVKDKWETPDYIFYPLNEKYNFTLDPCCEIHTAKCNKFYTEKENGLIQDWSNDISFVNPPYSRGNISNWMKKCYEESLNGSKIIALIPVSSSSSWWHNYVWKKGEIIFYKGRIKFKNAKFTAPFSSCLVLYNL